MCTETKRRVRRCFCHRKFALIFAILGCLQIGVFFWISIISNRQIEHASRANRIRQGNSPDSVITHVSVFQHARICSYEECLFIVFKTRKTIPNECLFVIHGANHQNSKNRTRGPRPIRLYPLLITGLGGSGTHYVTDLLRSVHIIRLDRN